MIKIVDRYILKELIPPFTVSLVFFSFIFLLSRILDIADMLVNFNVSFGAVLRLIIYSVSFFLQYTIPMSVMMAVLFVFIELSGSNEVLALKSGGIGVLRLLPSVVVFCLFGTFLTGIMTFYGLPWGKFSFKKEAYEIAKTNMAVSFKEKTFIDSFEGFALYINEIDQEKNIMRDIFLEDMNSADIPVTITAPEGRILQKDSGYTIELLNGSIIQIDKKDKSVHKTSFGAYTFSIDLPESLISENIQKKNEKEMYYLELKKYINGFDEKNSDYYSALLRLHEKFSIPFACIFLGLIGFSLGLRNKTGKKSSGIIYGIFLFVFYYVLFALGLSLGESRPEIYPPFAAMWIPDFIMFILGIFLLYLAVKEKNINLNMFSRD
ncbi:MAG: LPS export ABC transporter permease LptF [Desulfobacteraceae bacterium]|nr:LPS export ABC transporter permease LptF [Desulfobacteraceae bacterium]